jgi:hypothetical protein
MPTNLGPEAISAVKAGHTDVSAMYAGDTQIFPNEVVLQSAAYTDTSNISTAGGTRIFRVTGEIGCSYSLSGSLSGSYNLATSPFDHTVTAGSNGDCTASSRSFPVTLTPLGNTTLQGGGSTFTSSFSQGGGPGVTYYTPTGSFTVTNTNYVTTTVSGQLKWAQGAAWSIAWSYNNNSNISSANLAVAPGLAGTYGGTLPGSGSSGSGTGTFTLGAQSSTNVRFVLNFNSVGCFEAYSLSSSTQYP